jgi:hypothetical protein
MVCRQTRNLILCLRFVPVCSLRLRGKRIRQHRHGVDHGPYVRDEFASGAGRLDLGHGKAPVCSDAAGARQHCWGALLGPAYAMFALVMYKRLGLVGEALVQGVDSRSMHPRL